MVGATRVGMDGATRVSMEGAARVSMTDVGGNVCMAVCSKRLGR